MEGLEVNEIKLSYLKNNFRIDSEFYSKTNIEAENQLLGKGAIALGQIANLYDGPFGSEYHSSGYVEKGVPLIRMQNVLPNGLFNFSNLEFVSEADSTLLTKYTAFPGEIVTTKIGFLGYTTILPNNYEKYIFRRELTRITLKEHNVDPFYLATFLNSEYGRSQVYRYASGTSRDRVLLINQRHILIPLLSENFQKKIRSIINEALSLIHESHEVYDLAEKLLFEKLGLHNIKITEDPVNVVRLKDSLNTYGRIDAEYYQKKYQQISNFISGGNYDILGNIVSIKKSIEPGSDVYSEEGLPFLRVSDYNKMGVSEPEKKLSYSFWKDNEEMLLPLMPKKNTILFSKDGSLGTAYLLREDANFITSGAILHLSIIREQISPEFLTLLLNSKLVKYQGERDAGGSVILHWRLRQIERVLIPLIDYDKQLEIAELVSKSFILKDKSELLLQNARKAVDLAITENESNAIDFINNNS